MNDFSFLSSANTLEMASLLSLAIWYGLASDGMARMANEGHWGWNDGSDKNWPEAPNFPKKEGVRTLLPTKIIHFTVHQVVVLSSDRNQMYSCQLFLIQNLRLFFCLRSVSMSVTVLRNLSSCTSNFNLFLRSIAGNLCRRPKSVWWRNTCKNLVSIFADYSFQWQVTDLRQYE